MTVRPAAALLLLAPLLPAPAPAQDQVAFETRELDADFHCEGACFGDFDRDGVGDVASGPFWYEGPSFETRHRIHTGEPYDRDGYSDNFFAWARDLDGDGWEDLFVVGFPGKQAWWLENPAGEERHWERHLVHEGVDGESPEFTDVDGDGLEDLVCLTGGVLVWVERDRSDPRAPWKPHVLSGKLGLGRFTHGMGVGDVNGDGRADVLLNTGWWEQPASLEGDPVWERHPFLFSRGQGGAQMLVHDVDGDGDNDVVSSLNAHRYGLSWFEHVADGDGGIDFVAHPIMGESPGDHGCPLAVSELHALALADVDGDGLQDVITGKRYMSHGLQEAGAQDPAMLLWFRLERDGGGARFTPNVVHGHSGVGTQVFAGDVDRDGTLDVVVGNKMGTFVHLQRPEQEEAEDGEHDDGPFPPGGVPPEGRDGRPLNLDFETGTLADWTAEGEAFQGQPIEGDTVAPRHDFMTSDHAGRYWLGGYELVQDAPTGTLTSAPFEVTRPWAAFLIAGGARSKTRVEIVFAATGEPIATCVGRDHEALRPVVVDLSAHVGQEVFVRVVDEEAGGWGHVNFDDLRLYAERPVFAEGLEVHAQLDAVGHAGLGPADAAAAMTVPEGFRVELVAGEPDVHQPIAFAIDERGRLWVAEAHSYPIKRGPDGDPDDRILIFEDADGDGSFERRTLFADGLDLVSGLAVGHGGVFVGAAPELWFFPDRDRDDVPDGPPEVLLDGWGYEDTHETLNAFTWGPDGWLYGCHGVFTHSRVGAPGTPDEERVPLDAGLWRYHPTRREFEVFAWGTSNPWGVDFDDTGRAFLTACVIPHLYYAAQGGRYVRQAGSHFDPHVYADIPTIADHLHYLGETPHGGNDRSNAAGGGHAHCGAMIYLGDSWPERYRNTLFVNNVHGNRVNNELLEPDRSGYVGRHGDDFLLANDRWFRGINLEYGPDGSVYLIDWYDEQACHYVSDDVWNRTNGRIYKVVYGDTAPVQVDLAAMDEAELVELQLHANDWYVRTARRILAERGLSEAGAARLEEVLGGHPEVPRRLRALWTLHCASALRPDVLLGLLDGEHAMLRAWAVQLACERGSPGDAFLERMRDLANTDPSPVVRLYLASALQRLPLEERWPIAWGLALREEDAGDPNVPYLLWYGLAPLVPERPVEAMALASVCALPDVRGWIYRRAAADAACHPALVFALASARDDGERLAILGPALEALETRRGLEMPGSWPDAYRDLAASESDEVRHHALVLAALFGDSGAHPALRALLADRERESGERALALDALVRGRDVESVPVLCALLEEPSMRSAALKGLAAFDDPAVPRSILAGFAGFDETQRRDAVSTLTSRARSALALLDAVEAGDVPHAELTAFELRKLGALEDERLAARLEEVWGVVRAVPEDRRAEVRRWLEVLTDERLEAADLSLGRDVYARTCMRCHALYGVGEDLGPDITGSNRADLEYLLQNMVDPNAVIPNEYRVTVVRTTDGRIVTGILQSEEAGTLTLRTENERITLGLDEVGERKEELVSMMPEGQLATLGEEEVVALVAYLRHDRQVPRRMTEDNVAALFDGRTLSGWRGDPELWSVEDGEIVGRSPGLDRNAFLVSDYELEDFRLVLEVRLEPDAENGGIQLRSRALDGGDVSGYQADVGLGWWGRLYEEHGRGLVAEAGCADAVRPGEWNRYEIEAVGHRIRTWINGEPCIDLEDPAGALRGVLALQIHSGGPLEVRFRDFRLELDPAAEAPEAPGEQR